MIALSQELRERALRIAVRELVGSVGGQDAAAEIIGKSQSHVQRCCSLNDESSFLNARDIALLEMHGGRAFVTCALARQAGGVFIALPDAAIDEDSLAFQVMKLAHEVGDVSDTVRHALADGNVDAIEAGETERELNQLIEAATAMRSCVQVMRGALEN